MKYILASKSPRRREILENLGLEFEIVTADTDESCEERDPMRLVEILSERKGLAVRDLLLKEGRDLSDTVILSSDTVVAVDGEILGKPADISDAKRMLSLIEGRDHSVFSGIAATLIKGGEIAKAVSATEETVVRFSKMTDSDIEFYVNNESVLDKAGAYAIQGIASAWIDGIDGDYFNVVGLPVRALMKMLGEEMGVSLAMLRE